MNVLLSSKNNGVVWFLLKSLTFNHDVPIGGVFYRDVNSSLGAVLVGVFPKVRGASVFALVTNGKKIRL